MQTDLGGSKPKKCRGYALFGSFATSRQLLCAIVDTVENCRNVILDSVSLRHYVRKNKGKKLGYTL